MAINMPSGGQASPLERLGALLGVVKTGKDLYTDFKNSAKASDLEDRYKDPNSAESKTARELVSGLQGGPIPETVSRTQLEAQYGPISQLAQKNLDSKIQANLEKQKIGWQGEKDINVKKAELDYQLQQNPNKFGFERLPVENQEQIKKLADAKASHDEIAKQLEATHQTLTNPQVPYEQKIIAGRNLAKTLNSTEGRDAVSSDEASRLLSFLNTLPIGRPGFDMGPQLDKFADQVALKVRDVRQASNDIGNRIDQLYGRDTASLSVPIPALISKSGRKSQGLIPDAVAGDKPPIRAKDMEALQWLKSNPNSPDTAGVISKLRMRGLLK